MVESCGNRNFQPKLSRVRMAAWYVSLATTVAHIQLSTSVLASHEVVGVAVEKHFLFSQEMDWDRVKSYTSAVSIIERHRETRVFSQVYPSSDVDR